MTKSEGELKKRINEQLRQMRELPKILQLDRFIMGKADGFEYSQAWIDEVKSECCDVYITSSCWYQKWFGDSK